MDGAIDTTKQITSSLSRSGHGSERYPELRHVSKRTRTTGAHYVVALAAC